MMAAMPKKTSLVTVPKIKTDDKAPIRNHLKNDSVPKAKARRESPKKGTR